MQTRYGKEASLICNSPKASHQSSMAYWIIIVHRAFSLSLSPLHLESGEDPKTLDSIILRGWSISFVFSARIVLLRRRIRWTRRSSWTSRSWACRDRSMAAAASSSIWWIRRRSTRSTARRKKSFPATTSSPSGLLDPRRPPLPPPPSSSPRGAPWTPRWPPPILKNESVYLFIFLRQFASTYSFCSFVDWSDCLQWTFFFFFW